MIACVPVLSDMASADNTYSRVVAWLKILLPLIALGILSTMFLVARAVVPAQDLPFADVDVKELAEEQRIGQPNYSTVTDDGAAISVSARYARPDPDNPQRMTGTKIRADIDLPSGTRLMIAADRMVIDNSAGIAKLDDDVVVTTSDGYVIRTDGIEISLDATRVTSDSETTVLTPVGTLSADSFVLSKPAATDLNYVLVFNGHVKLLYDPNE